MLGQIFIGLVFIFHFFSLTTLSTESVATTNLVQDRAIVQRRRFVILRKQFPKRRTAVVTYPVISGLAPDVSRKVRKLLTFKNIFDYSLREYQTDSWLSEFSYVVNHNADSLLDLTFTQSGMAAYPDEQSKHFLIDLKTGNVIGAADAFESEKLAVLAALVDRKLQQEIEQLRKENTAAGDRDADEKASVNDAYDILRFELKDLDNFSVSKRGVSFLYDAGFPHVIKALEPEGHYYFSYAELKPYIKGSGPLGRFVR